MKCICGGDMILRFSKKYNSKFYGCSNYPDCKRTMGADKDGNPVGIIADDELKALRKQLRDILDEYFSTDYHWADVCDTANFLQHETGKPYVSRLDKEEIKKLLKKLGEKSA